MFFIPISFFIFIFFLFFVVSFFILIQVNLIGFAFIKIGIPHQLFIYHPGMEKKSDIANESAPVIAYISGTLGTLIGADLLNLKKIGKLGTPVASIGRAGTFDGIFLTRILAVIFSTLFTFG